MKSLYLFYSQFGNKPFKAFSYINLPLANTSLQDDRPITDG